MLSKATLGFIMNLTNFGYKLNILPFCWDKEAKILKNQPSEKYVIRIFGTSHHISIPTSVSALIFQLISALVFGNSLISGLRLCFGTHDGAFKLIFHATVFFWYGLSAFIQLNSYWNTDAICRAASGYFGYDQKLSSVYQLPKTPDKTLPLVVFFAVGMPPEAVSLFMLYAANPNSPAYLCSLFYTHPSSSVQLLFLAYEFLMALVMGINVTLYACLWITFQDTISFWLNELSWKTKKQRTKESLRLPANILLVFRSLQYLVHEFNKAATIAVFGQYFVTFLLFILSTVSMIQYFDPKYFQLETLSTLQGIQGAVEYFVHPNGVLLLIIWMSITVPKAGQLFNHSRNVGRAFREACIRATNSGDGKEGKKLSKEVSAVINSFPLLHINVGFLFHYERTTMLVVLNDASDHIVNALISF